ncbi:hypothetical protein D3C87_1552060 [compost metagenome]
MRLRQLCGAILTLFLATSALAALQERVEQNPLSSQSSSVEFHLGSHTENQQAIASYEKPQLKADSLNEIPASAAADMKDPLKYSVWVLIGLGPIMWIWLAFFPRIRRK